MFRKTKIILLINLASLFFLSCPPIVVADQLRNAIDQDYAYLDVLFKYFHAHPELSMQEVETSKRLSQEIEALGFKMTRNIAKTGFVGLMKNGDGPTVMIRADMDGLPIEEKSGLSYASNNRQINLRGEEVPVMHACGHDMHMTALVGTARRLAAMKDQWRGTLMLLGQPAEEAEGGAEAMIKDRLYERVGRPDYALALHVNSNTVAGNVYFADGLMYSSADTVRITINGVGTHGAAPHNGKDPIVIGSQIVMALQTIVSREISPLQPAVITVGSFHSGDAPNVISDKAVLELSVRANSEEVRTYLLDSIERVAINTARTAGVSENSLPEIFIYTDGVPTMINDAALAQRLRPVLTKTMGKSRVLPFVQKDMIAEDFPWLVRVKPAIPSVYFSVGGTSREVLDVAAAGGRPVADHHSALFKIDPEPSIKTGVEVMTNAAMELFAKP
ncbi:MAG: amidohydrolase [Gammaproteobacteria bacterium]|nr:amidohydrolase [Gammaproteobacteria bacterium]